MQAGRKEKFCQRIYFEKKKLKEALEPKQSGHSFSLSSTCSECDRLVCM